MIIEIGILGLILLLFILKIQFEYIVFIVVVSIVLYIIRNKNKLKEIDYREFKENSFKNVKDKADIIKRRIVYLKENSPFTLVIIAKIIFIIYLINNAEKEAIVIYFMIFGITTFTAYIIIKFLLDFKVFMCYDIEKKEMKAILMSFRLSSKYKIVDEDGKECILVNPIKTKYGEGFIANSINTKDRVIVANIIHNNIDTIPNITKAHIEMRKWAIKTMHEKNELSAMMPQKILVEAVKIFEKAHILANLTMKVEATEVLQLDKLPENEQLLAKKYYNEKEGVNNE